ncbi:MAG: DUF488 family protein [Burkholderiales bacterium]|nr:DUF488 family protein [Burkholderiales bacterium]
MSVRIVRLGSPRLPDEGLRIGTVRRPPRGVPKSEYATQNWYDVWFPNLAPSPETVKLAQDAATETDWKVFVRRYRAEMNTPDNAHALDLLAALSRTTDLSVGCYCADESRCHRSVLRALLREHGANLA